MTEERARLNTLPSKYPNVFAEGPLPWGFEIGDGWGTTIEALCETINTLLQVEPGATVSVLQIKEKFGTLRFYCRINRASDGLVQRIKAAIHEAELACATTCEICGQPAQLISDQNVLATLCPACHARVEEDS